MGGREKGLPEHRGRCLLSVEGGFCPDVLGSPVLDVRCMCPCIQAMLITSLWLALRAGDEAAHSPRSEAAHSPRSLASSERQSGEAENRMPNRERKVQQQKGRGGDPDRRAGK